MLGTGIMVMAVAPMVVGKEVVAEARVRGGTGAARAGARMEEVI